MTKRKRRRTEPDLGAVTVTKRELAGVLGITPRSVDRLILQGDLPRPARYGAGVPLAESITAYCRMQQARGAQPAAKLQAARLDVSAARLTKLRLENDERESKLVSIEEAVEANALLIGTSADALAEVVAHFEHRHDCGADVVAALQAHTDAALSALRQRAVELVGEERALDGDRWYDTTIRNPPPPPRRNVRRLAKRKR